MIRLLCLVLCMLSGGAFASVRTYAASVEQSNWELPEKSRLKCTLAHELPGYGKALFSSEASKQLNMEFELKMKLLPRRFAQAAVYSVPPRWMPGRAQRHIATMQLRTQYNGDLPEETAWTLLSELEKGNWPTIFYQDWYNRADAVAVSLNASNFFKAYMQFTDCVSSLLPYSFEDIAFTILSYDKNSVDLTKYSQDQLAKIGAYLQEDPSLELVLIDGHTDSYGGRWTNEQLSIRRSQTVKDYFTELGVEASRINITGHGKKRFIAPNDTADSRALNRRVIVQMRRS